MEKLDDSPKKITFEEFDKLGRKEFADRLTAVITKFYPFHDEAFVLSLNAKFGAGKTTFLEMWKNQLMKADFTVISINAWETDFDEEPLIPIISALLGGMDLDAEDKNLETAFMGALATFAIVGNSILANRTGINIYEIKKDVEGLLKDESIKSAGDELYKEYSFKKRAYENLKSEISAYIKAMPNDTDEPKKPLIIFVDELDRVRPDYSVKFLEAIKHIFSLQGVCFVLAVDRAQMEASVRQLYGDIDFENYYRRFITREAYLAEVKDLDLTLFIKSQADRFFDKAREVDVNFAIKQEDQDEFLRFVSGVCKAFNFAPRQIETLFRVFSQFMAVEEIDKMAKNSWVNASILLTAIFIESPSRYKGVGEGNLSVIELYDYIKGLNFNNTETDNYEKPIIGTLLSSSMTEDNADQVADIYIRHDDPDITPENLMAKKPNIINLLTKHVYDWGDASKTTVFQEIYKKMEKWDPFF